MCLTLKQNKTQINRKVCFFFVYISQWSLVTFFCSPIFWIMFHVTSSCKRPDRRRKRGIGESYKGEFFKLLSVDHSVT